MKSFKSLLTLLCLALALGASMPSVYAQEEAKPDAPPAVEAAPAAVVGTDAAPDAPAPVAAEPAPAEPAPAPTVKVNLEGVDLKAVAAEFAGSQQDASGLRERIATTQSLLNELLASQKAMEDGGSGARSILEAAFLASQEPVQVYVLNPGRLLVIFQGKEKVEAVLVTVRE